MMRMRGGVRLWSTDSIPGLASLGRRLGLPKALPSRADAFFEAAPGSASDGMEIDCHDGKPENVEVVLDGCMKADGIGVGKVPSVEMIGNTVS